VQLGPYAGGVMVQRGAVGTLWLFYIPALVFGLFALNLAVTPLWASTHESDLAWADGGLTVVLLALWFFAIARIPNWRRVRAVRQAVPGAVVRGARIDSHGNAWIAETARRNGNRSGMIRQVVAVAATPNDLQFWSGAGDNLALAGSVNWGDIRSVTAGEGARIDVDTKDGTFGFRMINDRWLSTSLLRGVRRARLVEQLESLRHNCRDA
jgi:hypothetical protein